MDIDLYIARHGQTEENLRRILQGQMPGTLTEEGIHQAEELRDKLKDVDFGCIYSSDLRRALKTARIIADLTIVLLLRNLYCASAISAFTQVVRISASVMHLTQVRKLWNNWHSVE